MVKSGMSINITYFVHGTTFDNELDISSGWKDIDISEEGVNQSILLKEQTQDKKFDVVFCSDLKRAVHSANLSFFGRVPIIEDARLRECNYGDFNGALSATVEPLQEKFINQRFPNGESYEDVKARVSDFLEFLKKNYDGKNVAIVAHKAPQLAFDVLLKNKTWEQAFAEDWRKTHTWQPGWEYKLN
jgi:alpha-ribazole phosphatase/probable phosphoglycerate mutase